MRTGLLRLMQVSCASAAISWQPPESLGHPPFHKYKLQRSLGQPGNWVSANRNLDDEDTSWVDSGLEVRIFGGVLVYLGFFGEVVSASCYNPRP